MSDSMNDHQGRIYQWLQDHGAEERAIEFRPHEFLRKCGFLATTEAVERVKADLMVMEKDGWVTIGPSTSAGHIVMATKKQADLLLLPFERLIQKRLPTLPQNLLLTGLGTLTYSALGTGQGVLQADNDFDPDSLVLVDEFSDSISAYIAELFDGSIKVESVIEVPHGA